MRPDPLLPRRHADGAIDIGFYARRAMMLRRHAIRLGVRGAFRALRRVAGRGGRDDTPDRFRDGGYALSGRSAEHRGRSPAVAGTPPARE